MSLHNATPRFPFRVALLRSARARCCPSIA